MHESPTSSVVQSVTEASAWCPHIIPAPLLTNCHASQKRVGTPYLRLVSSKGLSVNHLSGGDLRRGSETGKRRKPTGDGIKPATFVALGPDKLGMDPPAPGWRLLWGPYVSKTSDLLHVAPSSSCSQRKPSGTRSRCHQKVQKRSPLPLFPQNQRK